MMDEFVGFKSGCEYCHGHRIYVPRGSACIKCVARRPIVEDENDGSGESKPQTCKHCGKAVR